jgi:endo-1,4-beta-xylanase
VKKTILILATILVFGKCSSPEASKENAASLMESFENSFLVGSALNEDIVSGRDTASLAIVKQQFNTITAENVMKAGPINPQPGVYNFAPADAYVAF